jgi:hypothetical protein
MMACDRRLSSLNFQPLATATVVSSKNRARKEKRNQRRRGLAAKTMERARMNTGRLGADPITPSILTDSQAGFGAALVPS